MAKAAQSVLGVLCVAALISLPGMQVAQPSAAPEPVLAVAAPRSAPTTAAEPQVAGAPSAAERRGGVGGVGGRGGDARAAVEQPTAASRPDNGQWLWPTPSKLITSPFGFRSDPFTGGSAFHSGIDFGDPCGTGTGATRPGSVTFAGPAGGYGLRVVVAHENGLSSSYSHLQAIAVAVGDRVDQGQLLGGVGTTGRSTGCHLHFEIMINDAFTDPMPYLAGNPAANPPTFGNGDVGYTPVTDPSTTPPPTESKRPDDPCVISDDPQDAADSGGLIPVGPAPSATGTPAPSATPCPTPSSDPSSSAPPSSSDSPDESATSTSAAPPTTPAAENSHQSPSEPGTSEPGPSSPEPGTPADSSAAQSSDAPSTAPDESVPEVVVPPVETSQPPAPTATSSELIGGSSQGSPEVAAASSEPLSTGPVAGAS